MITYVVGDLFTSPAKVLVNTVNTVGVMGKGIAYTFKRVYPEMFQEYQYYCENGMFDVGKLWLYKTSHKWILNFPTKKHWRNKSKLEYIEEGLKKFVDTYDSKGIVSVSFPMLGCGNGELDWNAQVQPLMEKYLKPLPIDAYIHVFPKGSNFVPEHREIANMRRWLRDEPKSLPFNEFWEDLVSITRSQQEFATSVSNSPFSVHLNESNKNLVIMDGNIDIIIGHNTLQDFWQLVRSSGYCISQEFPVGLNKYADYITAMLGSLTYIKVIKLSRKHKISSRDLGIQLIPESQVFASIPLELHEAATA